MKSEKAKRFIEFYHPNMMISDREKRLEQIEKQGALDEIEELERLATVGKQYLERIDRLRKEVGIHGGTHLELQAIAVDGQYESYIELFYTDALFATMTNKKENEYE